MSIKRFARLAYAEINKLVGIAAVTAIVGVGMMWGCGEDNNGGGGGGGGGGGSQFNPNITYGEFTDSRDSKKYKTVTIGSQIWMAENLNYDTANGTGSGCYNNSPDSCAKYGRLYDWNTAMAEAGSSDVNPSSVQGVCPAGWHLPSAAEWTALETAVGGSSTAGTKLKSKTGWNTEIRYVAGTDDYGFSALPGGFRWSDDSFYYVGLDGYWWTATQYDGGDAYFRDMYYYRHGVRRGYNYKDFGFSVRCVKD